MKYDKVFVSLEEASELECISYHNILMRIQRNPQNFIIKKEKSTDGGKDRTFISVSSLSEKAQAEYRKRESKEKNSENSIEEIQEWYVDVDINWYKANYEKNFNEALGKFYII